MKLSAFRSIAPRIALLAALAALAGFTACRTLYDTPGDFKESRKRIDQGQGAKEAAIILRDFKDIPPQLQDEAVQNLDAVKGEVGQKSLIALLDDPRVKDQAVREDIAARLMKRDEDGSTEALLVACQNRPELVNAETIEFFANKKYKPAIPLLQKQIEAGKFVPESFSALLKMEDDGANTYILSLAADKTKPEPVRLRAMEIVAELNETDEGLRAKAVPVYTAIVENYEQEPAALVSLAVQGLGRWGESAAAFDILKNIYENSEDETLRANALLAMARLRGVAPDVIEREYETALVDVDAEMERMRREQEKQPATITEKKKIEPTPTVKRTQTTGKLRTYGADYRNQLDRRFDEAFGPDLSGEIQNTINNALKSYAGWNENNPTAAFILRSYRKHFGGDNAAQKERLQLGLSHPGSFSVIVRNVIDEYKTDAMRAYAISQFFEGIKRWQATIILDLAKSGKI